MGLNDAEILGILKAYEWLVAKELRWITVPKTSLTPHFDNVNYSCCFSGLFP